MERNVDTESNWENRFLEQGENKTVEEQVYVEYNFLHQ